MAKENDDWGYDRIVGALANLGYKVCDQTVGNVLQRHGLPPAPERNGCLSALGLVVSDVTSAMMSSVASAPPSARRNPVTTRSACPR
jgi:hypothetical protein